MTDRSGQKFTLSLAEFNASTITSLYLYGHDEAPEGLYDRVKASDFERITVQVDAADFMANGAGRLVKPSDIPMVRAFFEDGVGARSLAAGTYSPDQLRAALGIELNTRQATITMPRRDDGGADYQSNAYILGGVTYTLTNATRFNVIDLGDGVFDYFLSDLAIIPATGQSPKDGEDFDFEGSGISAIYNLVAEGRVDPYGIGDTVELEFILSDGSEAALGNSDGVPTIGRYDIGDLSEDIAFVSSIQIGTAEVAWRSLEALLPSFERQFIDEGVLLYEDERGSIVYGSGEGEELRVGNPFVGGDGPTWGTVLAGDGNDTVLGSSPPLVFASENAGED